MPRFSYSAVRLLLGGLAGAAVAAAAPQAGAQVSHCGEQTFSVYFEQFQPGLTADARSALKEAQKSMRGCRIEHARVIGLAGAPGNPADNQLLSEKRTHTVADVLVDGGWPRSRLELVALGDRGAKVGDKDRPIRRRVRVEVSSSPAR